MPEYFYVLTGGGPGDSTRMTAIYIYELAFHKFQMGYAALVTITLLLLLMMLTLLQFHLSQKWVHYE